MPPDAKINFRRSLNVASFARKLKIPPYSDVVLQASYDALVNDHPGCFSEKKHTISMHQR